MATFIFKELSLPFVNKIGIPKRAGKKQHTNLTFNIDKPLIIIFQIVKYKTTQYICK